MRLEKDGLREATKEYTGFPESHTFQPKQPPRVSKRLYQPYKTFLQLTDCSLTCGSKDAKGSGLYSPGQTHLSTFHTTARRRTLPHLSAFKPKLDSMFATCRMQVERIENMSGTVDGCFCEEEVQTVQIRVLEYS